MIVYFSSDLIWASRIKSTADALSLSCRPVRTPDMLLARLADAPEADPVSSLIVDLSAEEACFELIRFARSNESAAPLPGSPVRPKLRILAFGPHVAKDLFQAARDAGADDVLPNGAFAQSLPDILTQLAARQISTP